MEFPNEDENREKDFIVAKSPMLRVFFDPTIASDIIAWQEKVLDVSQESASIIKSEIGEQKIKNSLAHLTSEYFGRNVFPEDSDEEQVTNLAASIAVVGYQIGDQGQTMSVYGDLYDNLCVYGLLQYNTESAAFVYKALATGLLWARKSEAEFLEPFTEFVKGLDMTGL